MRRPNDRLAQMLLRYSSALKPLRDVPVIGKWVRSIGEKVVPRDARTWVQIQHGAATGLWLRLNPRTGYDVVKGAGEPEVQEALRQYLRPAMTFYDIGANIGFFSLLAARLVGERGRVVAFEADPEIAGRLRENCEHNGFAWAQVVEAAVWSEGGKVLFSRTDPITSPDRGLGHVVDSANGDTIEVKAVALDTLAGVDAPDFIKCDVEGAEVEVFRGARRMLAQKRPAILCEIHSEENRRALLADLAKLGYDCKDCSASHVLALPR